MPTEPNTVAPKYQALAASDIIKLGDEYRYKCANAELTCAWNIVEKGDATLDQQVGRYTSYDWRRRVTDFTAISESKHVVLTLRVTGYRVQDPLRLEIDQCFMEIAHDDPETILKAKQELVDRARKYMDWLRGPKHNTVVATDSAGNAY